MNQQEEIAEVVQGIIVGYNKIERQTNRVTVQNLEWDEGADYISCRTESYEEFSKFSNMIALFGMTAKLDPDMGDGMTYFSIDLPKPHGN